jgi:hypothetical protein
MLNFFLSVRVVGVVGGYSSLLFVRAYVRRLNLAALQSGLSWDKIKL